MDQLTEEQQKELQEKLQSMTPDEISQLQKQQCVFCKIVSEKIPSKKIYEDEYCLAILDINPATKGHVLLIPKEHFAIMPQVPELVLGHMFVISRHISQAILRGFKATGTTIFTQNGSAAGQKAPHFMIHIIPRREGDGILEIEEKFIDKEMQEKVKIAVENKLNEILGIKKKTVAVEKKKEVAESEEKEESSEKEVTETVEETEDQDKEHDEETEDDEEKEDEEKGEKVSLDDIANLFK